MIYEDLEGQEHPEKEFKLPTNDPCQVCSDLYWKKFDIRKLLLVSLDIGINLVFGFLWTLFFPDTSGWEIPFLSFPASYLSVTYRKIKEQ